MRHKKYRQHQQPDLWQPSIDDWAGKLIVASSLVLLVMCITIFTGLMMG